MCGDDVRSDGPEIGALRDNGSGLFFRHDDPAALSECLVGHFENTAMKARLSKGATATVAEEHTVPRMVDGLEAAIRGNPRAK